MEDLWLLIAAFAGGFAIGTAERRRKKKTARHKGSPLNRKDIAWANKVIDGRVRGDRTHD